MPAPKGKLVTPVTFDPDSNLSRLESETDGSLHVFITGGNLDTTPHNLLDGDIHPDTVAGSPVEGDVIVGIDQGAPGIKWQRLARGTSAQVLTVQADNSLAWEDAGGGAVVQEVNTQSGSVATGTTIIPYDDTIPQITEGTEFITRTITPTNSANKLKIEVSLQLGVSVATNLTVALFKNSTSDALAAVGHFIADINHFTTITFIHYMTTGATSEITFRVRAGGSGASTVTFNGQATVRKYGGVSASSITITEIVP